MSCSRQVTIFINDFYFFYFLNFYVKRISYIQFYFLILLMHNLGSNTKTKTLKPKQKKILVNKNTINWPDSSELTWHSYLERYLHKPHQVAKLRLEDHRLGASTWQQTYWHVHIARVHLWGEGHGNRHICTYKALAINHLRRLQNTQITVKSQVSHIPGKLLT